MSFHMFEKQKVVPRMWRRFSGHVAEVWRVCGGGMEGVWRRFRGNVEEVWRQCGGSLEVGFL